ncbi:hypothetical protein Tco_0010519 [Tanacetum coccineum]
MRGGSSDSGRSFLRSTGGGMYRDSGSGGSRRDCQCGITAEQGHWRAILSVWIWVEHPDDGSNGDGTGGGDESVGGAVHLAKAHPRQEVVRVR